MTPDQISTIALTLAGERALSTSQTQMNLTITCADADTAGTLRDEMQRAGLQATRHMRFDAVVVVQRRPHQQIVIRKREPNFHIGRFHGDRGER
jgi:hypothetical protein